MNKIKTRHLPGTKILGVPGIKSLIILNNNNNNKKRLWSKQLNKRGKQ